MKAKKWLIWTVDGVGTFLLSVWYSDLRLQPIPPETREYWVRTMFDKFE